MILSSLYIIVAASLPGDTPAGSTTALKKGRDPQRQIDGRTDRQTLIYDPSKGVYIDPSTTYIFKQFKQIM